MLAKSGLVLIGRFALQYAASARASPRLQAPRCRPSASSPSSAFPCSIAIPRVNRPSSIQLVINADDFGISQPANEAIADCYQNGILTSTSVMANMPAVGAAAEMSADLDGLGFGAHVSWNVGRPLLGDRVPLLCDADGWLHPSYLYHLRMSRHAEYLRQAGAEGKAQVEKLLSLGFVLDHINSQSHVHMIPGLHDVLARLASDFELPHARYSWEKRTRHPGGSIPNLVKNLLINAMANRRPQYRHAEMTFIGVRNTGQMDLERMQFYLSNLQSFGCAKIELLSHPGCHDRDLSSEQYQPFVYRYLREVGRSQEREALLSPLLRETIEKQGIELTTFGELYAHSHRD